MIDQQKLYEVLEKLGQKLGVASEHVYGVLITQMKYQAVTRLLLLPIVLGLFLVLFILSEGG